MQSFKDQEFYGRSKADRYVDAAFVDVSFINAEFPATYPRDVLPGRWSTIRNVELRNIGQQNCALTGTALEEVTLQNLKRLGDAPLFFWSCVFKHVILSGRISGLKINRTFDLPRDRMIQDHWDRATLEFYQMTDWALDISGAKFPGGVSFEAVPGDLIRRNAKTQVLVRRTKLNGADWKTFDYLGTALDLQLGAFLSDSLFDSVVLTARDDAKWRKRDLAVLQMLRREQIADPD